MKESKKDSMEESKKDSMEERKGGLQRGKGRMTLVSSREVRQIEGLCV